MVFNKYTPQARQAIFFARWEVSELGAAAIGPEHVLLGLLRANEVMFSELLSPDKSACQIREQVESGVVLYERINTSVEVPLSDECKAALALAQQEAELSSPGRVTPAHLLLGLLRQEGTLAARVLRENGVTLGTVRERLGGAAI